MNLLAAYTTSGMGETITKIKKMEKKDEKEKQETGTMGINSSTTYSCCNKKEDIARQRQ